MTAAQLSGGLEGVPWIFSRVGFPRPAKVQLPYAIRADGTPGAFVSATFGTQVTPQAFACALAAYPYADCFAYAFDAGLHGLNDGFAVLAGTEVSTTFNVPEPGGVVQLVWGLGGLAALHGLWRRKDRRQA